MPDKTKNEITEKNRRLSNIEQSVKNLKASPLYSSRVENGYNPVIGEGDPDADIMFIGEAPGEKEALSGRPFVGRAGQLLDDLLQSIELSREEVYITNIVKDRPPHNRDPKAAEIELYAPFMMEQINIIDPQIIVTLGRFAMNFILKSFSSPKHGSTIGDLHGQILKVETDLSGIHFLPLYHPAAIFYNRSLEETLYKDFKKLSKYA